MFVNDSIQASGVMGLRYRDIGLLFTFALVIRILNILLMPDGTEYFSFPDSADYSELLALWQESGSLIGWLHATDGLPSERMPGYMWFLVGLSKLGIESFRGIAFAQAAIDSITCIFVAGIGAQISAPLGRIAGVLAALSPTMIVHSTLVLQDTLMLLPMTICLFLALVALKRESYVAALGCGIAFGLAFFTRSVVQYMVVLLPFFVLFALLASLYFTSIRPMARLGMVVVLGLGIVLAPLGYRLAHMGTLYPTTQSGLHALFWTVTMVRMSESGRTFEQQVPFTREIVKGEFDRLGVSELDLTLIERDKVYRRLAVQELLNTSPLILAKVWVRGAAVSLVAPAVLSDGRVRQLERPSFFATPGRSLPERAYRYFFDDPGLFQAIVIAAMVFSMIFALLAAVGFVRLMFREPLVAVAGALFISYFVLLSGPTSGPKYRMPYMQVLLVFAAAGVPIRRQSVRAEDSAKSESS